MTFSENEAKLPIRILHIVTVMDRGGIETMLMNYYRAIDRSLIQFDFLTHRQEKGAYDDEIRLLGGRIYSVSRLKPFSTAYQGELNAFFAQHREYRIVHSHINSLSAFALRAAKKNGVQIRIAHSHIDNAEKTVKGLVKRLCKPLLCKNANRLFACSQKAGEWMYANRQFTVFNNAIDTVCFSYNMDNRDRVRRQLGLADKYVVGHAGRFTSQKNHSFLLNTFYELKSIKPNSHLLLIGRGELESSIRALATELGLEDSVSFLGVRDDLNRLYQAMDVFVFPSVYEGFGIVLLEAQAAGLNCVTSTAVPNDADVTGLVVHIPLDLGAKEWAKYIAQAEDGAAARHSGAKEIEDAGFDIARNADMLSRFYIDTWNDLNAGEKI